MSQKTRRRHHRQKCIRRAQQAKKAQQRQIFPFLKLPGEIRNRIYLEMIYSVYYDWDGNWRPTWMLGIWCNVRQHPANLPLRLPSTVGSLVPQPDSEWLDERNVPGNSHKLLDNLFRDVLRPLKSFRYLTGQIYREFSACAISQKYFAIQSSASILLKTIEWDNRLYSIRDLHIHFGVCKFRKHGELVAKRKPATEKESSAFFELATHLASHDVVKVATVLRLKSLCLTLSFIPKENQIDELLGDNITLAIISGLNKNVQSVWIRRLPNGTHFGSDWTTLTSALDKESFKEYRASDGQSASIARCTGIGGGF